MGKQGRREYIRSPCLLFKYNIDALALKISAQHKAIYVELAPFFSTVFPFQFNITAGLPWKNEFDINKLTSPVANCPLSSYG